MFWVSQIHTRKWGHRRLRQCRFQLFEDPPHCFPDSLLQTLQQHRHRVGNPSAPLHPRAGARGLQDKITAQSPARLPPAVFPGPRWSFSGPCCPLSRSPAASRAESSQEESRQLPWPCGDGIPAEQACSPEESVYPRGTRRVSASLSCPLPASTAPLGTDRTLCASARGFLLRLQTGPSPPEAAGPAGPHYQGGAYTSMNDTGRVVQHHP